MNRTHLNFQMNRREFFGRFAFGLGGAALCGLFHRDALAAPGAAASPWRLDTLGSPWCPEDQGRYRRGAGACRAG